MNNLARDTEAIQCTAQVYSTRLRHLAYGIVRDDRDAEECENDTYLCAWDSIPPKVPRTYLFAFLAKITRNLALDKYKRQTAAKRNAHIVSLSTEMEQCLPAVEETESEVHRAELCRSISAFLRMQSAEKRKLFLRRYWYMDSVTELSKRFAMSETGGVSMRRRFFQLFAALLSCVLLSGTSVSYAGEAEREATDLFQLVLYAEESLDDEQAELDLSGIRIDVYSSELASDDGGSGGSAYTHDEFFSVYTDAEGQVQFSRPTEMFLILVDVSTLPRNTGIAISTKFYRENITQDRLAISKVDKVEIEKIETSEEFYVNAYNSEGTRINVDFTLPEISSEIAGNTKTVCLEARVGDMTETCEYTIHVAETKKPEIHCVEYVEDLMVGVDADVEEDSVMPERANPAKAIGAVLLTGFLRFIKTRLLW